MRERKKKNEKVPAVESSAGVKSEQTNNLYFGTGAGANAGGNQDFSRHMHYHFDNFSLEMLRQAIQEVVLSPQQEKSKQDGVLESIIDCHDIVLIRADDDCYKYFINRKKGSEELLSAGAFSYMIEINSEHLITLSSFIFKIQSPEEDCLSVNGYEVLSLWGLITSAFELYEVKNIVIEMNTISKDTLCLLKQKFPLEKRKGSLITSRSKWIDALSELYTIARFDLPSCQSDIATVFEKNLKEILRESLGLPGYPVPVPINEKCTSAAYVAGFGRHIYMYPYKNTFLVWTDYIPKEYLSWLDSGFNDAHPLTMMEPGKLFYPQFLDSRMHPIYLLFLEVCAEIMCRSIAQGIPLRGFISTGHAIIDTKRSKFSGEVIDELLSIPAENNAFTVTFGKSFNNHHPLWPQYVIPNPQSTQKDFTGNQVPMLLDYPRRWREDHAEEDINACFDKIQRLFGDDLLSQNLAAFFDFSENHSNWSDEINWDNVKTILDFYRSARAWLMSIQQ